MIITLIAIAAVVLGFVFIVIDWEGFGCGLVSIGVVAFILCIGLILAGHIGEDIRIEKNKIEYESLCKRQEIINSEYEDVSKSEVIKDIAKWNRNVMSTKYWTYNPWTNWFFSKRVADAMQYVEEGE